MADLTRKRVEEAIACEESGCHGGECAHHGVLLSAARALLGPTLGRACSLGERCIHGFVDVECPGKSIPLVAGLEDDDANK